MKPITRPIQDFAKFINKHIMRSIDINRKGKSLNRKISLISVLVMWDFFASSTFEGEILLISLLHTLLVNDFLFPHSNITRAPRKNNFLTLEAHTNTSGWLKRARERRGVGMERIWFDNNEGLILWSTTVDWGAR